MLNIVIPMAGAGSRFSSQGYDLPKPLIPVHGMPMLQWVINNLKPEFEHRFIFIAQKQHVVNYNLDALLELWAPSSILVTVNGLTEGAACTVLQAKPWINNADALMIANSDQYIDTSINDYLAEMQHRELDGLIMTMTAQDPKWSFVGLDHRNWVVRVVEKEVISHEATVGIYNFARGSDFVQAAESMIAQNLRVNQEFYVAPVYNQLIEQGAKIGIYNIGAEGQGMYGLGTPSDLEKFISHPLSRQIVEQI